MRAPGALDEMVDGTGQFRQHWRRILDPLFGLGREALAERARLLQLAFAEEGFASLLPGTRSVNWHCDPIPPPLSGAEFAMLEAGLEQRARLLQAILADVYGPQNLLAEGAIPPPVVFANPAFLRPCCSPEGLQGGSPLLQFYAADLVRGPEGTWRVLADRTAGAAGAAYALENRQMLTRIFPELFQSQEIWRITPFFETWQQALQRLAPEDSINPGVALLTSGHKDPAWFEHVLLARELSCRLVEAGDLTVRGGRVFLKTLRGLEPVDVLLRRQDGRTIDPLELGGSAGSGVPGLLDAARDGAVRIVNDPGAGFAEAPALSAFLPDLCLRLLGEQLRMPSLLTLWLGDPRAREIVTGDFSNWLIRPALDGTVAPVDAAELSGAGQDKLASRIAAAPWQFAATASVPPSVIPSVAKRGLEPRRLVLRLFLLFDGGRWHAMRGGLARALSDDDLLAGPLPSNATSKDVWVLVEDEDRIVSQPFVPVPPLPIRRTQGDLPARVAEDFFWFGRYLERLESAARLQRATLGRLGSPGPMPRERAELHVLMACLVHTGLVSRESTLGPGTQALRESLVRTASEDGPVALLLGDVARLAEQLRDRLTGEMYVAIVQSLRGIDEAFQQVGPASDPRSLDRLLHAMTAVLRFASTVAGLSAENMVRGGGRLFLDLGRRLERAARVATQVGFALEPQGAATQPGHIEAGLRLALELRDSTITYRSRYLTVVQPAPALDLILADEDNPRALAFQLTALRDLLTEIAGGTRTLLARAAADLLEETRAAVLSVASARHQEEAAMKLPPKLRAIEDKVSALSDRITRQYFDLLPTAHSLGVAADPLRIRGVA